MSHGSAWPVEQVTVHRWPWRACQPVCCQSSRICWEPDNKTESGCWTKAASHAYGNGILQMFSLEVSSCFNGEVKEWSNSEQELEAVLCVECPSFDMLPGSALVMQPQEKGQWGILAAVLGVKAFYLVFDLCLLIFVEGESCCRDILGPAYVFCIVGLSTSY